MRNPFFSLKTIIYLKFLLIFFSAYCSYAQVSPIPDAIIPPSPTAYNLGKYGLMKTGLFTGTVNAEIPLFEYKTPNLTIPISLSYNSNGIRVEDAESRTGLVWNLNAGGVIIRNIRGNPDVYPTPIYTMAAPFPDEITDKLLFDFNSNSGDVTLMHHYLLRANTPGFDTEYDLFSFNFLNKSGKFIVTSRGEVVQESKSSLRIEVTNIDEGFTITDDQGIQYKFTVTETTQSSAGPDARNPPAVTSWYLSQIIHPKGDVIDLSYDRIVTTISYNGTQSYTMLDPFIGGLGVDAAAWGNFRTSNSGFKQGLIQLNTIEGKRISRISGNYAGSVTFQHSLPNNGQPGDNLLNNIQFQNNQGKLLENITLDYTQTSNNRVFLNAVTFLNPYKKYLLEYYSPELFPARTSWGQDYWGYYNGQTTNNSMLPYDAEAAAQFPGFTLYGNREPNPSYAVYGLLKKITYPTKGYSVMQYEANTYYTSRQQNTNQQVSFNNESDATATGEFSTEVITPGTTQTVDVFVTLSNSSQCPVSTDPDVVRRKGAQIRMFDLTTGQNVLFNGNTNSTITITNGLGDRTYSINLTAGHRYLLFYSLFACSRLTGVLSYVKASTPVYYNAVTGGLRLRSAEHFSRDGEKTSSFYKYVDALGSENSSGVLAFNPISFYSVLTKTFYNPTVPCRPPFFQPEEERLDYRYNEYRLSTNSLDALFNRAGNNITYKGVIESDALNNANGCILHLFRTSIDGGGQIITPFKHSQIANRAVTNIAWDNGLEKRTVYYGMKNGSPRIQKEDVFEYAVKQARWVPMIQVNQRYPTPCGILFPPLGGDRDPLNTCGCKAMSFLNSSVSASRRYAYGICTATHRHSWFEDPSGIIKCNANGNQNTLDYINDPLYGQPVGWTFTYNGIYQLNAVYYHFYSFLHNLSSRKEVIYDDNGGSLTTITNYEYDDVNHLIATTYQNSKGETIKTINKLAKDFSGNAVYDLMTDRNMTGVVIETRASNLTTNKEISAVRNEYALWNNQFLLPKEIKRSISGNPLTTEVSILKYDDRNNIRELKKVNAPNEVYLWGYNSQYPVARIDGSNYESVIQKVTQPQIDAATAVANNDGNVRALLASLRTIPRAMVTSFTYDPLIGMTSETGTGGRVTTYHYDGFGRLSLIRDQDNNILKKFCYNFSGEPEDCNN